MITSFIKYFFIFLCNFYFFDKLLNNNRTKKRIIIDIVFSAVCSILLYFIRIPMPHLYLLIVTLIFFIIAKLTRKVTFKVAFTTSVISFGLSYFLYFISLLVLFPFVPILLIITKQKSLIYNIGFPIIGILQTILSTMPFKFKRFRRGMPFLLEKSSGIAGTTISVILLFMTLFYGSQNEIIIAISISITWLCGFLLILWWKHQLTKSYLKKIKTNEINDLRRQIEELKYENENFSKLIHKDNKLIPAMEMAVTAVIDAHISCNSDTEHILQLRDDLQALSQERYGILSSYEQDVVALPSTGLVRTDALIQYLQKKAIVNRVNFSYSISDNLKQLKKGIVNEDSLNTIIADLCENAIIAVKDSYIKKVLLSIQKENNTLCINVYDSGSHFDANVIKHMGKIRYTTHGDSGGSGIGLMTTLELMKMYSASFIIDEDCNVTPYSKKISLCFDGLCQIKVHSNREEVINVLRIREDILLL